MSMQSKRLGGGVGLTTGSYGMYTVPSNALAVLKTLSVASTNGSAPMNWALGIGTALSGRIYENQYLANRQSRIIDFSLVLNANETLFFFCSGNGTVDVTCHGLEQYL